MEYFTIKNLFSKEECDSIIKYSIDNLKLENALVNIKNKSEQKADIRKSSIVFIDVNDTFSFVKKRILEQIPNYIKVKGYNIDFENNFYQFTEYKKGEYYEWHTDSTKEGKYSERYCSVVIQLNDEYDGGDLELKNIINGNENIIKFEKGAGNLFVFLSSILHRVNSVKSGTRYSLVNWFSLTPNTNFKKTLL